MNYGHWTLRVAEEDPIPFGFVYEISRKSDGKTYIGSKQVWTNRKRQPRKGRKRTSRKQAFTNWRRYTGSCNSLNEEIAEKGMGAFRFEIVEWADSKSELAYREAKRQFDTGALLRDDYYNGIIHVRISSPRTPWKRHNC